MVSKLLVLLVVSYFSSSAFGVNGGRQAGARDLRFVVDVGGCSASVIGPDAVLLAARCNKRVINFVFDNQNYVGDCEDHPNWSSGRFDFDIALCKLRSEIRDTAQLARIERVQVSHNGRLIFAGFGDGRLRFANLVIQDIFSNSFAADGDGEIQAGDVGGPAIVDVGDLVLGPFRILGVAIARISNSRKVLFSRIDVADKFFQDFIRVRGGKICGINDECAGQVGDECQSEQDIVNFFEAELANAQLLLRQCLERRI